MPAVPSPEALLINSLEEPRTKKERERADNPRGAKKKQTGTPYADIDGHKTDEIGRPVPRIPKERILSRRSARICPAPGCKNPPSKCQIMCRYHWFMVPPTLRTNLWRHSVWNPDMKRLKVLVKDILVWLDLALGPALTPENVANRVMELLNPMPSVEGVPDPQYWCEDVHKAVKLAIEEGVSITRNRELGRSFDVVWQDRLNCVWR